MSTIKTRKMDNLKSLKNMLLPIFKQYGVHTAYLFGSRATGNAYEDSDYDIGCLFKKYDPKHHNIDFIVALQMELEEALAPMAVDLLLLDSAPIVLRYEVISGGIVLFCEGDDFRTDFEDMVLRDYLDFKPFLDQYDREVLEAIQGGHFFA